MKKNHFTLTLLAALMFCGCEGAFDPGNTPEEPLIRAGGIIDRIYMTSEATSHNETACTVSIENNRLLLTLDKASTFTVTIWHQEAAEFFFSLKYVNTPSTSINISLFPNGNYTLYINEQGIFCFAIKDGVAYTKSDNKADLVDWNEIWQQATNVPKGTTTTFMNGYPGQTTWALGERCNLQMDEDCNFFIDRYNSVVQIVDLGQMKSLNDIPLQLPLNGWSDRVPIQPLHGYIIYAEDLPEDNKPANAVFIRLFVLDFNLNDDKTTTGHMQFQIVQEGYSRFDSDNKFVLLGINDEEPELDFSTAYYQLSEEQRKNWPFRKVEAFRIHLYVEDAVNVTRFGYVDDEIQETNWIKMPFDIKFTLGKQYCFDIFTDDGEDFHLDIYEEYLDYREPYDIKSGYKKGIMQPSEFSPFKLNYHEDGTTYYTTELPITIRPQTAPYLIQIVDTRGNMKAIKSLSADGFSAQFDEVKGCGSDEPREKELRANPYNILPVQTMRLSDDEEADLATVAAVKLRTFGPAADTPIILSYEIEYENGHISPIFKEDVTDQVVAQPQGGVITIYLPDNEESF